MAHSTWARDFLFFPNANVDAAILSSPRHLQYKVAGQIKLDMKAERVGPYNSDPYMDMSDIASSADDRMYADWVIVPAFNFGHQGACYFMHKQNTGPVQDSNGAVRSALYRIITDDITGEVLYVGDMPETDTFQVVHMRHVSGALHERAVCFFEGSVFRQAIKANDGKISLAHLAKAMTLCIHTRETRMCIMCGQHPAAYCMCPVILRQAEHPHDMRFYGHNARTHLGQFQGKQYLMYMKNGRCLYNRPQLTQHRTDDKMDQNVADCLREWAVQDRLGKGNPRSSLISEKDRLITQAVFNDDKSFDDIIDDLADVENETGSTVSPMNVTGPSNEVDISHDLPHVNEHTVIRFDPDSYATRQQAMLSPGSELAARLEATHIMPQQGSSAAHQMQHDELRAQFGLHQRQVHEEFVMEEHYSSQKQQTQRRNAQRQMDDAQMLHMQQSGLLPQGTMSPLNSSAVTSPRPIAADMGVGTAITKNPMCRETYAQTSLPSDRSTHSSTQSVRTANGYARDAAAKLNALELPGCATGGNSPASSGTGFDTRPSSRVSAANVYQPAAAMSDVRFLPPMGSAQSGAAHYVDRPIPISARQLAPQADHLATFGTSPPPPALAASYASRAAPFSPGSSGASSIADSIDSQRGTRIRARRRLGGSTSSTRTIYPPIRERRLLPRGIQPAAPTVSPHDRELELRIRKREAARRSDQRRLQRVQQLREETLALEARAVELREREEQLKNENESLRHKVAALGRQS